jgi:hypothetical protein
VQLVRRRRVYRVRYLERLAHLDGPRLVRVLLLRPPPALLLVAPAVAAADGRALPAVVAIADREGRRAEPGYHGRQGREHEREDRPEGRDAGADLSLSAGPSSVGTCSYYCQVVFDCAGEEGGILHPRLVVRREEHPVRVVRPDDSRHGDQVSDSEKNRDADLLVLVHGQVEDDGDGKRCNDKLRESLNRSSPHRSPALVHAACMIV